MVPAVLDAVPPATAAGSELGVLVDRRSAAGPVELADVDVVLSAAAAQPFVGPVSAALVQHVSVIDQHSLVQLDSPLTLQRLSLPFWWQEVTRGAAYCLPHDPPWTGSMHFPPPSASKSLSLSSSTLVPSSILALSLPASASVSLPALQAEHNSRVFVIERAIATPFDVNLMRSQV